MFKMRAIKTLSQRAKPEVDQARLKMRAVAYALLHIIREFHLKSEDVKRPIGWIIRRIVKAASRISRGGGR